MHLHTTTCFHPLRLVFTSCLLVCAPAALLGRGFSHLQRYGGLRGISGVDIRPVAATVCPGTRAWLGLGGGGEIYFPGPGSIPKCSIPALGRDWALIVRCGHQDVDFVPLETRSDPSGARVLVQTVIGTGWVSKQHRFRKSLAPYFALRQLCAGERWIAPVFWRRQAAPSVSWWSFRGTAGVF